MVLSSLICQLPVESTGLEQTEQFWSLLSSVGVVPKVLGYFWDSMDLFLFI